MQNEKADLEAVYHGCLVLSALDYIVAAICAINGDSHFVAFISLAVGMWIYGIWIKSKADKLGE
jgi:hypothetical protein